MNPIKYNVPISYEAYRDKFELSDSAEVIPVEIQFQMDYADYETINHSPCSRMTRKDIRKYITSQIKKIFTFQALEIFSSYSVLQNEVMKETFCCNILFLKIKVIKISSNFSFLEGVVSEIISSLESNLEAFETKLNNLQKMTACMVKTTELLLRGYLNANSNSYSNWFISWGVEALREVTKDMENYWLASHLEKINLKAFNEKMQSFFLFQYLAINQTEYLIERNKINWLQRLPNEAIVRLCSYLSSEEQPEHKDLLNFRIVNWKNFTSPAIRFSLKNLTDYYKVILVDLNDVLEKKLENENDYGYENKYYKKICSTYGYGWNFRWTWLAANYSTPSDWCTDDLKIIQRRLTLAVEQMSKIMEDESCSAVCTTKSANPK